MLVSKFPMGTKIITGQVSALASSAVANTPGSITLTWTNPVGYKYFKGVMIRYKAGSYPVSVTDGAQAYVGTGVTTTVTGLTANTRYYFRAFAYAQNNAGTKTVYATTTAGAQAVALTYANPVTALAVAKVSASSLSCSWVAPANTYSQVMVRYKAGGYPTSISDGTQAYLGTGTSVTVSGLAANTTYYFRAFVSNADTAYNTNASQQGSNTTKVIAGQIVFTSTQTCTIPAGVTTIDIFAVGGGAGGQNDVANYYQRGGGGGGGGYTARSLARAVTPGAQHSVVVGAGGAIGGNGGTSSFGVLCSANGGNAGSTLLDVPNWGKGGDGGSGGGGGAHEAGSTSYDGTNGGSDGASAVPSTTGESGASTVRPGIGQLTTTRAFGEGGNTLYSGGGGGGAAYDNWYGDPGLGGAGGGGAGANAWNNIAAPAVTANTGGGGGGQGVRRYGTTVHTSAAAGGSGVVIIRWAEQ